MNDNYKLNFDPGEIFIFLPIKKSPSRAPAITRICLGRPTRLRNIHLGIESPAKPALMTPDSVQ